MSKTAVLIVEDEAIVAADLAVKLKQMGYDVVGIASCCEEAMDLIRHAPTDLVLMDILLEGSVDGIETAAAIRGKYDVPVVYLTAYSDQATLARAKPSNPYGYILKPFEELELSTQIELALYRHRTDRRLREQEELLRVTLSSIGDAVISTDADGKITFVNPVAETVSGWLSSEVMGWPVERIFCLVDDHTGKPAQNPVATVLDRSCSISLNDNVSLSTKSGRIVPIESKVSPILNKAGKVIGAVLVFRDVTERKSAEEAMQQLNQSLEQQVEERTRLAESRAGQLQALAAELVEAEERERKRMADILHGDLQQILAGANLQLQGALEAPDPRHLVKEVVKMLDASIKTTRSLSQQLSPTSFRYAGLFPALEGLARQMKARFGLHVNLINHIESKRKMENISLKMFIYRAVQELLFNVIKHAEVEAADVEISSSDNLLVVTVRDAGQGFNPAVLDAFSAGFGLGLLSLRERAVYLGGSLSIDSTEGHGSCFTLTVPHLKEDEKRRQPDTAEAQ